MAVTGITNAAFSALRGQYFEKVGLQVLTPRLTLYELATKKGLPAGLGDVVKWHRYALGSTTVSAYVLTEGTTPTPEALSATSVSATVLQIGRSVRVSDMVEWTAASMSVISDAVRLVSDRAGIMIDKYLFEVAYGTSSVPSGAGFPIMYGNDATTKGTLSTVTSGDKLTAAGLRAARAELERKFVMPHTGSDFIAVLHPNTIFNGLMDDSEWQNANQYTGEQVKLFNGEAGKFAGIRIVSSPNVYNSTSGTSTAVTAYYGLIFGNESLGVTEISGTNGGFKIYVVKPNPYDTNNLLQQFSDVGSKATLAAQILNASAGLTLATAD